LCSGEASPPPFTSELQRIRKMRAWFHPSPPIASRFSVSRGLACILVGLNFLLQISMSTPHRSSIPPAPLLRRCSVWLDIFPLSLSFERSAFSQRDLSPPTTSSFFGMFHQLRRHGRDVSFSPGPSVLAPGFPHFLVAWSAGDPLRHLRSLYTTFRSWSCVGSAQSPFVGGLPFRSAVGVPPPQRSLCTYILEAFSTRPVPVVTRCCFLCVFPAKYFFGVISLGEFFSFPCFFPPGGSKYSRSGFQMSVLPSR